MKKSASTAVALLLALVPTSTAQTFDSTSNGSDGALDLTTPGTVVFDPTIFGPPLDPDGDNVYHFTTVNVGPGVTVKLRGDVINGPVFWLAQGSITIAGTIDLNGEAGYNDIASIAGRVHSVPGAGGYSGGLGSWSTVSPAQPGFGPGGGRLIPQSFGCNPISEGGRIVVNTFLVPLIGGSGGAGGNRGGGAGAGALLLSSSTSVAVTGSIMANGGSGPRTGGGRMAGGGGGGSVRIVAPTITGGGVISVNGGAGSECSRQGDAGRVRLEAFTFDTTLDGARATPFHLFLPQDRPSSVRLLTVAGIPVPPSPTGSFTMPDITINAALAVSFAIEARNIPVGTVVTLQIFPETGRTKSLTRRLSKGPIRFLRPRPQPLFPPGFRAASFEPSGSSEAFMVKEAVDTQPFSGSSSSCDSGGIGW